MLGPGAHLEWGLGTAGRNTRQERDERDREAKQRKEERHDRGSEAGVHGADAGISQRRRHLRQGLGGEGEATLPWDSARTGALPESLGNAPGSRETAQTTGCPSSTGRRGLWPGWGAGAPGALKGSPQRPGLSLGGRTVSWPRVPHSLQPLACLRDSHAGGCRGAPGPREEATES